MTRLRTLIHWLLGKTPPPGDPVAEALNRFRNPSADTLELVRRLVAVLRPQNRRDQASAERYLFMLDRLEADAALCAAFRSRIIHFIATRRLVTFFTDSGILPGTGFFSEWWRILGSRLLPEVLPLAVPAHALAGKQLWVSHGLQDMVIPLAQAQRIREHFGALPVALDGADFPGGHELRPAELQQWIAWLQRIAGTTNTNTAETP